MKTKNHTLNLILALTFSSASIVQAQTPAPTQTPAVSPANAPAIPPVVRRVRGEITAINATTMTVKTTAGETVVLTLSPKLTVSEIKPIASTDIKTGSYVGSAAMPMLDGTLQALEVLLFPEAARGTAEGHSPWDLQPQSTMTNGTVTADTMTANGRSLVVRYKGQEKTLLIPNAAPLVTSVPADASILIVGANVLLNVTQIDDKATVIRASAGRNGFKPPM